MRQRLSLLEVAQVRDRQTAREERRNLHDAYPRLPHWHVEPSVEYVQTLADEQIFAVQPVDGIVRDIVVAWIAGDDSTQLVNSAVDQAIRHAPLPTGIIGHLMTLPKKRQTQLYSLMNEEAIEQATVDPLQTPGKKRWRMRLIQIHGGSHAEDVTGPLDRINPESAHSRILDSPDPCRVIVTLEERGLPEACLIESRRAEEMMRRMTAAEWAAAITVCSVDDVTAFRPEQTADPEGARRMLVQLAATGLVERSGSGVYKVLDDVLAANSPHLPEGVIAKGLKATLRRLAQEPALRQILRDVLGVRRRMIGDKEFVRRLQALKPRLESLVPREDVLTFRGVIDDEVRALAQALLEETDEPVPSSRERPARYHARRGAAQPGNDGDGRERAVHEIRPRRRLAT